MTEGARPHCFLNLQNGCVTRLVCSLSTASPVQCLLVAAGVYGCRKAPEPNWGVEQAEEDKSPNGCECGRGHP